MKSTRIQIGVMWRIILIFIISVLLTKSLGAQSSYLNNYYYFDDFSTNKVEFDSYSHSPFMDPGGIHLGGAIIRYYPYHIMLEHGSEEWGHAYLRYKFPINNYKDSIVLSGQLIVNLGYSGSSDLLSEISCSKDGANWILLALDVLPGDHSYALPAQVLGDSSVYIELFCRAGTPYHAIIDALSINLDLSSFGWDVTGRIGYYSNDDSVDNALVKANTVYLDTTDSNGDYGLLDLPPDNYVVRPEKENDLGTSISAYDAAWILQYGVGLRTFTPYQMIAGDVSGNGSVTAYDAAKILQFGVGLINQFPIMDDSTHFWRFVPEDFPISQTNWNLAPDSIAYAPLNSDTTDNYKGIIYGDVSGNWHPSEAPSMALGKSSSETVDVGFADVNGETGDKVILPMFIENNSNVVAISFSLEYDAKLLKALHVTKTELTKDWQIAYHIKDGLLKVALAGTSPFAIPGTILNLEFEVLNSGSTDATSPLRISEVSINEGNIAANVQEAQFSLGAPAPKEYALFQNYPNPFNLTTMIKYQLPKAEKVVLRIFNLRGEEITTLVNDSKEAGAYSAQWNGSDNYGREVSSGVYYCSLIAGNFKSLRKVIVLK